MSRARTQARGGRSAAACYDPPVKPRQVLATATTPEGGLLELVRDAVGWNIDCDKRVLMTSQTHGSERAMARVACHHVSSQASPRVLIGGLGLGYTLRAALDRLPEQASVVCVELMEAIVEWHAGPLGPLAEHPTADPRVEVVVADVVEHLQRETGDFDAILLDVDNGPIPMTVYSNGWLYTAEGLARLRGLLRPGGVLVVWSAGDDERFARRMRTAGLETEVSRVQARTGRRKRRGGGHAHVLFVGRRAP